MDSITSVTYTTKITQPSYAVTYTKPTRYMVTFPHTENNIVVTVNGTTRRDYEYYNSTVTFAPRVLKDGDQVTITRVTEIEAPEPTIETFAEFNPGDAIKGQDLNENFRLLARRVQELEDLTRSQVYMSPTPPPDHLLHEGFQWVNTQTWIQSVYNGIQFVQTSPQSAIEPNIK